MRIWSSQNLKEQNKLTKSLKIGQLSAMQIASFKKRPLADVPQAWELSFFLQTNTTFYSLKRPSEFNEIDLILNLT